MNGRRVRVNSGERLWQLLWVQPGVEARAVSAARRVARPMALLMDDAEARTGMLGFLTDAADGLVGPDPPAPQAGM